MHGSSIYIIAFFSVLNVGIIADFIKYPSESQFDILAFNILGSIMLMLATLILIHVHKRLTKVNKPQVFLISDRYGSE